MLSSPTKPASPTAFATALAILREQGATLVPSFDDVDVIEGQGTVGLEIADQLGEDPPLIAVPVGGGGLAAGIALALGLVLGTCFDGLNSR